jgi:hypothetical protein
MIVIRRGCTQYFRALQGSLSYDDVNSSSRSLRYFTMIVFYVDSCFRKIIVLNKNRNIFCIENQKIIFIVR